LENSTHELENSPAAQRFDVLTPVLSVREHIRMATTTTQHQHPPPLNFLRGRQARADVVRRITMERQCEL
jgi:hypothetical protein